MILLWLCGQGEGKQRGSNKEKLFEEGAGGMKKRARWEIGKSSKKSGKNNWGFSKKQDTSKRDRVCSREAEESHKRGARGRWQRRIA